MVGGLAPPTGSPPSGSRRPGNGGRAPPGGSGIATRRSLGTTRGLLPVLLFLLLPVLSAASGGATPDSPGTEADNTPPTAAFTVDPETGHVRMRFNVNASSSWDAEDPTDALEVRWDWEDDGRWDTRWSPYKHQGTDYWQRGTFTIRLEVRDTHGATDSTTRTVRVENAPPVARLVVTPHQGYLDTLYGFDASDSGDIEDPSEALEVRWDFDGDRLWDTAWSDAKKAVHRYDAENSYRPRLQVRDTEGALDTALVVVTVGTDTQPPALLHRPLTEAAAGHPISVSVYAADPAGVNRVELVYRGTKVTASTTVKMTYVGTDVYRATIPAQVLSGTLRYRIVAWDEHGNGAGSPVEGDHAVPVLVPGEVPRPDARDRQLRTHPSGAFSLELPTDWEVEWDRQDPELGLYELRADAPATARGPATLAVFSQEGRVETSEAWLLEQAEGLLEAIQAEESVHVARAPAVVATTSGKAAFFEIHYRADGAFQVIGMVPSPAQGRMWTVVGTATLEAADAHRPAFDAAIQSFEVPDAEEPPFPFSLPYVTEIRNVLLVVVVLVGLGLLRWLGRKGLRAAWRSLRGGGKAPSEAGPDGTPGQDSPEDG